mmetsp:Transcript_4317/g.6397  ORF Transcript_4317/g.6397 Transcript_4317/m.6397 type:complete len:232 (-) Transcript_4317:271-966(-)
MLQPRRDAFNNPLRLPCIGGLIFSQTVQDEHLTPLGTFVERREQFLQHAGADLHHVSARRFGNFRQGRNAIGNDGRVRVGNQIVKRFQKAFFFDEQGRNVVQFGHADGGGFPHVGVFVSQGPGQRFAQVFGNSIDPNAPHGPYGECSNEWVGIVGVLDKCVDCQQCQFRLTFRIINQIQIYELLQLDISRLNTVEYVCEEHRNVLAYGHGGDDFFNGVHFHVAIGRVNFHS